MRRAAKVSDLYYWDLNDSMGEEKLYGVAILNQTELLVGIASEELKQVYDEAFADGKLEELVDAKSGQKKFSRFPRNHIRAIGSAPSGDRLRIEVDGVVRNVSNFDSTKELNLTVLDLASKILPNANGAEEEIPSLKAGFKLGLISPVIWAMGLSIGLAFILPVLKERLTDDSDLLPSSAQSIIANFPDWAVFATAVAIIGLSALSVVNKSKRPVKTFMFRQQLVEEKATPALPSNYKQEHKEAS